MNVKHFLAYYERVADAPDAIARLRRFILDLAVRGKLVPQDAGGELASELLKRAENEKAKLVRAGKIRKPKLSEPICRDELPIDLPKNWAWSRLCEIGRLSGGMTPSMSRPDFWNGDIVWLSPKDIKTDEVVDSELKISDLGLAETRLELYRPGCLFIVARSGILKRTFPVSINRAPAAANQDVKVLVPFLDGQERYLQIMFRGLTDFLLRRLVKTGTTVQSLKYAEFEQQPFPIPPLAEQRRIVAKVDELMSLCDRLEVARADRETVRDRLAAASLVRLNAPDPETFKDDIDFALNALPALTARPDQIKALRQTILNLAVRGKLVPQDAKDVPASDLLKRIANKRFELLRSGYPNPDEARAQTKKLTEQSFPDGLEALPSGWAWATLLQCSMLVIDCKNKTAPYANSGIRLIRTTNVRDGRMNAIDQKYVDQNTYRIWSARCTPEPGDILITREAPMGEVCIIPTGEKICLGQRMMLARLVPNTISAEFLIYSLRDPKLMDRVQDKPIGATVQHLRVGGVETLLVPLPPLAEQHRIVAKIDALMALCDKLEASLAAAADTRRCLFDALLAEALAPHEDRLLEAAE